MHPSSPAPAPSTSWAEARVLEFGSPLRNACGRVQLDWRAPGDRLPLELVVECPDLTGVVAEVWTNANHPDRPDLYDAHPMALIAREGARAVFRVELSIERVGNYRATARLRHAGGGVRWAGEQGFADLLFRPRRSEVQAMELEEVSVPNVNRGEGGTPGTFADLMERGSPLRNGRYTLEWLAERGKNSVWLLPVLELGGAPPEDGETSPYAVRDFFAVRPALARAARGLTGAAARRAAAEEFRALVAHAHRLGLKVLLDLPLNHVAAGHRFGDHFVTGSGAGERREVRYDDFSQLAVPAERLREVAQRLAERTGRGAALEQLAPWMFGALDGDPHGARTAAGIAPGGWFEWKDTLQLNHGRRRVGFRAWRDEPPTPEAQAVQDWLGRVLRFWAVDMGVDGFRIDHLAGMPPGFLEDACNRVQADADLHRPGETLIWIGEDFETADFTQHWVDVLQGGFFHALAAARAPADLEQIVEAPWFCHLLGLGSHDEGRFFERCGDDRRAVLLASLTHLLGGPVLEVAGDCLGDREQLPFRFHRGMPSLAAPDERARKIAEALGEVERAKRQCAALRCGGRVWLRTAGALHPQVVALARPAEAADEPGALVFANMDPEHERSAVFALDPRSRTRLLAGLEPRPLLGAARAERAVEVVGDAVSVSLAPLGLCVVLL